MARKTALSRKAVSLRTALWPRSLLGWWAHPVLRADAFLLLASALWGFGFVAQRLGMRTLGPFTYNAARFLLGTLALLLAVRWAFGARAWSALWQHRSGWFWGLWAGLWLFAAASAQQIGLVTTGAGKAGLITSLYTLWVYLLDRLQGRARGWRPLLAVGLALGGLAILNRTDDPLWQWKTGDAWVLLGSWLWAAHVHWIDQAMKRVHPAPFVVAQFGLTGLLSAGVAWLWEQPSWGAMAQTWGPILYGGLVSVAVAFTLQVLGQRHAPPTHAAILLSLEAVFSILGGLLFLGESLTLTAFVGSGLMVSAVLLSAPRGDA